MTTNKKKLKTLSPLSWQYLARFWNFEFDPCPIIFKWVLNIKRNNNKEGFWAYAIWLLLIKAIHEWLFYTKKKK